VEASCVVSKSPLAALFQREERFSLDKFPLWQKSTRVTVDEYLSQGIISKDGTVNREGFQRLIDLIGDRLFKSKPYPAPEKYLDMRYLRRAQQELGIIPGR
jgi:hypothetical protein